MPETPRSGRYSVTFAVVLVSVFSYALMQSMAIPVLPTIQHALHTSQDTVTWVLTIFLLTSSVATPILGRYGDIVGKKKVLVGVLLVLALGSVLAALATTIAVMIVARAIQGVAGAVLPLSFGIIRDEAPSHKVRSSISIAAALLAVGAGAGIVLAGPIVKALSFHWLFWIPAGVVVVAAITAMVAVPESPTRSPGRLAIGPAALLSVWLVALILALSYGQQWGWASGRILGLLAASIVVGALWVRVELTVTQPLIDMRMMRVPAVWTTNLVAMLFGIGMYAAIAFIPEFVQTPRSVGYGFGASATASGLFLVPMTVTMFVCGLLSSRLAARFGSKLVLLVGSMAAIAPYGLLAFANRQQWVIYISLALLGVSLGFAYAAMSNLIVESVPAHQVGVASGMNANIRTIGGSIGTAVMATIVTSHLGFHGFPALSGYRNGFAFLTISAVLATAACVIIPSARRNEMALLDSAHVVEHGESAIVAAAGLVDAE